MQFMHSISDSPAPLIAIKAQQEIVRRSAQLSALRYLPVHFYRIRKRLAVSLPIIEVFPPTYAVRTFSSTYPWGIWLKWALEDRILALGEYVCQTGDTIAHDAVVLHLSALANWKTYRETARPDLAKTR